MHKLRKDSTSTHPLTCYDKGMKNITALEDFIWEHHFKERAVKLPDDRRAETVRDLREIIEEMHHAGLAAAVIGRYLNKDHTTILHHLGRMDIKPHSQELTTIQKEETELYEKKKELREQINAETLRQKELRSITYWQKRGDADVMRQKVFAMYRDGASYHEIMLKHKIGHSRVQGLLIQHPGYQKIKPTRKAKNAPRPVCQHDLQGNFIREYPTGRIAANALGIANVAISMCAQGKIPSAAGFKWKYRDSV